MAQPHIARLVPQATSEDLGVRMRTVLSEALGEGHAAAAVVIGSDVPDLDGRAVAAVLEAVSSPPPSSSSADVAFAPSPDGGFYAVAARAARPGMFGGEGGAAAVPWSTPGALAGAAAAVRAAGLAVHSGEGLAALADVDTVEVTNMSRQARARGSGARARVRLKKKKKTGDDRCLSLTHEAHGPPPTHTHTSCFFHSHCCV